MTVMMSLAIAMGTAFTMRPGVMALCGSAIGALTGSPSHPKRAIFAPGMGDITASVVVLAKMASPTKR